MKIKKAKNNSGYSLAETLITIVIVGILSIACANMLIFAYSMFEKVMGGGSASIKYKTFRFTTEKIFRNMSKEGPLIFDIIDEDPCSTYNRPPATEEEERDCIKMDVSYYPVPFKGVFSTRKYYEPAVDKNTTKYRKSNGDTDYGLWLGHVGRAVAVYSTTDSHKNDENYKRYLMRMEETTSSGTVTRSVVLYTWIAERESNGEFKKISSMEEQLKEYPFDRAMRDVLLPEVHDFQVTNRLNNLYTERVNQTKYENISVVRLFVKLGEDADMQYSNDLIFANKNIYGDVDKLFSEISFDNIVN